MLRAELKSATGSTWQAGPIQGRQAPPESHLHSYGRPRAVAHHHGRAQLQAGCQGGTQPGGCGPGVGGDGSSIQCCTRSSCGGHVLRPGLPWCSVRHALFPHANQEWHTRGLQLLQSRAWMCRGNTIAVNQPGLYALHAMVHVVLLA